jgi:hypothetical protein
VGFIHEIMTIVLVVFIFVLLELITTVDLQNVILEFSSQSHMFLTVHLVQLPVDMANC